jgi:copper chaperone CopZ
MKNIFVIIALLLSSSLFAQVKQADLQASGLTCSMCSKAIYKALVALPFVKEVKPDIQTSTYAITFKEGIQPNFDAIGKAVVDAGFSVAKLKATINFNEASVQNDAHIKVGDETFHFLHVDKQTLYGDVTVSLVDKNFVTAKEFKKYNQYTAMKCYATGVMESCCSKNLGKTGTRIYHVTI